MVPRLPADSRNYPRDPRSRPLRAGLPDGGYVYVQDADRTIHVLVDGPHHHVRVLGHAAPALYAGDLTIKRGRIIDLTNLSGTFQFDEREGLLAIADAFAEQGYIIDKGAVRLFPIDGQRPIVLR